MKLKKIQQHYRIPSYIQKGKSIEADDKKH